MKTWRLACIQILEFVVEACTDRRIEPSQLVVVVEPKGHRRIRAMTEAAFRKGIRTGQTLHTAWSMCPDLIVLDWCETRIQKRTGDVVRALASVSPIVQAMSTHEGCFMVDASGMSLLGGENAFANRARQACSSLGYSKVRVGVANQWTAAFMALHKTSESAPVFYVSEEDEDGFICEFLIEELVCEPVVKRGLKLLGIRTLGQLRALPRASVRDRFGLLVDPLFSLLDALEHRTPMAMKEVTSPCVEWALEAPVSSTEHLALGVRHLCLSLSTLLIDIAHRTSSIDVCLDLENNTNLRECIELTQPTIDAQMMWQLVMARLGHERLTDLDAAIVNIVLQAKRLTPLRGDQLRLANDRWEPHKAEALLNRLRARCNQPMVYQAHQLDRVRDSSRYAWVPIQNMEVASNACVHSERIIPSLVRKKLPKPIVIDVRTDLSNRPTAIRMSGRWCVVDTLTRARASGGWWSKDIYAFEEFCIRIESGDMYWLRYMPMMVCWHLMGGWD